MKNAARTVAFILCGLALATSVWAKSAPFDESKQIGDLTLHKKTESDYTAYWFFPIFSVALYGPKTAAPQQLFPPEKEQPLGLSIYYHRSIKKERFVEQARKVLADLYSDSTLAPLEERIAQINRAYQNVEDGDAYSLVYEPGSGTTLYLNGEQQVTIPGHDFAKIYFSIWLGEHPQSQKIRSDLLAAL